MDDASVYSQYAPDLAEAVAWEIHAWVESSALNGNESLGAWHIDSESRNEDGARIMRIYCSDEIASKMKILPPGIRSDLERYWKSQLVDCVHEFALDWNKNHDAKLPVIENSAASFDQIPVFSDFGDDVLDADTEWRTEWFGDYTCMFEVRALPDGDDGLKLEIAYNIEGPVFPGTSDKIAWKQDFGRPELERFAAAPGYPGKGFDDAAWDIVNSCMEQYADEDQAPTPGR